MIWPPWALGLARARSLVAVHPQVIDGMEQIVDSESILGQHRRHDATDMLASIPPWWLFAARNRR